MIIYECPYDACDLSIIGSKTGLREHMESKHPITLQYHKQHPEKDLDERLKAAEQNYLKHRINTEMVVEADSNE